MAVAKKDASVAKRGPALWPDEGVDRAFREMFRDFFTGSLLERFTDTGPGGIRVEEFVKDGACVVRAELPGMDPAKDIDISISDGYLNVRAHREERTEEERPSGYRTEFRYGAFHRSIKLPEGVAESDVKASYKDGILEIKLPIAATTKEPTKIAVDYT